MLVDLPLTKRLSRAGTPRLIDRLPNFAATSRSRSISSSREVGRRPVAIVAETDNPPYWFPYSFLMRDEAAA